MSLLQDLFKGPGNVGWDLGRVMSAFGIVSLVGAQFHAIFMGQALDISAFGVAIAGVLGGAGALIALKDRARLPGTGAEG